MGGISKRLRRLKRRSVSITIFVLLVLLLNLLLLWLRPLPSTTPSPLILTLTSSQSAGNVLTPLVLHIATTTNLTTTSIITTNVSHSLPPPPPSPYAQPLANFKLFYHQLLTEKLTAERPWFMHQGVVRPTSAHASRLAIWPEEVSAEDRLRPQSDRIVNQLMYVPEDYDEAQFRPKGPKPLKKILLFFGLHGWGPDLSLGRRRFLSDRCPVSACYLTSDLGKITDADAVIFKDRFVWPASGRQRMNQTWILFLLESPYNTQRFTYLDSQIFNWTATYRHDSDIVTPYEKFVDYRSVSPAQNISTLSPLKVCI